MHTCFGGLFLYGQFFTIVIPSVSELTVGLAAVGLVFVVLCVTVGLVFVVMCVTVGLVFCCVVCDCWLGVCCDGRDCWLGVCSVVCDCCLGVCYVVCGLLDWCLLLSSWMWASSAESAALSPTRQTCLRSYALACCK